MDKKTVFALLAVVFASVLIISCDKRNGNETNMQYMPDMADTPVVKAQRSYIDPPPLSLTMDAILYADNPADSGKLLKNPLAGGGQQEWHLERGKDLWETYCVVCHGPAGKGNGKIVDKYPRPPDLTMDFYSEKEDGDIFHTITFGSLSKIMPYYGHAIEAKERWQVVMYLRTLQKVEN